MQSTNPLEANDTKTRVLLICGAIAGPLFTIAWFVTGLTRADYDPMRHPISDLSLGDFGWIQDASFIITGLLTIALALGLWTGLQISTRAKWGAILLGIAGIGFLGSGFYVTDPLNGYPPGTPVLPLSPSFSGRLHLFFASLAFGLPSACFMFASYFTRLHERNWAIYSRITAIAFITIYAIAIAGFLQVDGLASFAGLFQRIALMIGLTWMTLLPMYLLKPTSETRPSATTG